MTRWLPSGFTQLRLPQVYAIDGAAAAFRNGAKVVTLDAPPGVGKTLVGAVLGEELSAPTLYLCKSHHLQEQVERDFPWAPVLKGRKNYPTELDPTVSAASCNYRKGHPCDFCTSKQACPYEMKKQEALIARMANLNTSYFVTETNGPGRFKGFPLVVLDECDQLEDLLVENIELNYTMRQLTKLGLAHIRWPQQKSAGKHGAGTTEHLRWLDGVGKAAMDGIEKLGRHVSRHPDDNDSANLLQDLQSFEHKVARAQVGIDAGTWYYDETQSQWGPGLRFAPIMGAELGEPYFFDHGQRFLCMSGTIGSGREWLREVGFGGHAEVIECPSPFSIENREIRFAPVASLNKDNWMESWPATARAVRAIRELHPGERTLVHVQSYRHAQTIADELRDPLVMAHAQEKVAGKLTVKWFEETEGACLVSPVMSRGYDGTDDKVRIIIVAKMPYPNFGDARIAKRVFSSPLGRREGQLWLEARVARDLMQATSRGTRHEHDWSVSYIIDERFAGFWSDAKDQLSDWWKEALVWGGPWREAIERVKVTTV